MIAKTLLGVCIVQMLVLIISVYFSITIGPTHAIGSTMPLTLICLSAGTFGGVLALLASTAPAFLSELGLGPRLHIRFEPIDGMDNDYVHRWFQQWKDDSGKIIKADGTLVRLEVFNTGSIGAEKIECVVESIRCIDSIGSLHVPLGAPKHLRWADSWEKNFVDMKVGGVYKNKEVVLPVLSPQARIFLDFGFVFPSNSPFYKDWINPRVHEGLFNPKASGRDLIVDNKFWCLHLASRWIPSARSILVPPSASSVTYRLQLRLTAKNYHGVTCAIDVTLSNVNKLLNANFEEGSVVGNSRKAAISIKVHREQRSSTARRAAMISPPS